MAAIRNIRSIRPLSHRDKGSFPWVLVAFNILFCLTFLIKYVKCFRRL